VWLRSLVPRRPVGRRGVGRAGARVVLAALTTRSRRRPGVRPAIRRVPALVHLTGPDRSGDGRCGRRCPPRRPRARRRIHHAPPKRHCLRSSRPRWRPARLVTMPPVGPAAVVRRPRRMTVADGKPHATGRRRRGTRGASCRMTLISNHSKRQGERDLWITVRCRGGAVPGYRRSQVSRSTSGLWRGASESPKQWVAERPAVSGRFGAWCQASAKLHTPLAPHRECFRACGDGQSAQLRSRASASGTGTSGVGAGGPHDGLMRGDGTPALWKGRARIQHGRRDREIHLRQRRRGPSRR
jgi:hypothetical protein